MKKNFSNITNPAEILMDKSTQNTKTDDTATPITTKTSNGQIPEGYKRDMTLVEKRCKRLQVLLTPSLWETLRRMAFEQRRSINDIINEAIEKHIKK